MLIHIAVDPRVVVLATGQYRSGHEVPITGRLGVYPDLSRVSGEMSRGGGRQGEAGRGEVGIRGLPIASNLVEQKLTSLSRAFNIPVPVPCRAEASCPLDCGAGSQCSAESWGRNVYVGNCKLADLYQHDFSGGSDLFTRLRLRTGVPWWEEEGEPLDLEEDI